MHGAASAQLDITFPQPSPQLSIDVDCQNVSHWQQGSWQVYHLQGQVQLSQGNVHLSSEQAILWVDVPDANDITNTEQATQILLYMEQSVAVEIGQLNESNAPPNRFTDTTWLGRLRTKSSLDFSQPIIEISPENVPIIFERGMQRRQQEINQIATVQYSGQVNTVISPLTGQVQQLWDPTAPAPTPAPITPIVQQPTLAPNPGLPINPQRGLGQSDVTTNVQILARGETGGNLRRIRGNQPGEWIYINTGGTRVNIDSTRLSEINQPGQPASSQLVIQANNVVGWENPVINPDGSTGTRSELYLEGDVIFSQGDRVIYADRMYYDVNSRSGTILNADVLTPVASYDGLLRLKADVVQQLDENNLQAFSAAITSSRLGVPRYWLQSDQLNLTRTQNSPRDIVSGLPLIDPQTGQPISNEDFFVTSQDNRVYLGGVPVFYWPTINTDLNNPNYYIERLRIGNDTVFGFQLGVGLDLFQLFGIRNRPEQGRWTGNLDYLSERGLGFGTDLDYSDSSFLGYPGQTEGFLRSWFIFDQDVDNLGLDRRAVPIDDEFRGRVTWRHRQQFAPGYSLRAELGYLSDQNFIQQFFEREWDNDKDQTTGLWLERNVLNQSFNLTANARLNDFFTQTEWLPRLDHFIIGQPLFADRAVWHGKSSVGYGRFRSAEPPTNAIDLAKFDPLAWEGPDVEGFVGNTRHEIDFPVQLGAVKVVPYVLGDLSYWQEDLQAEDLFRATGQAGVRTSLPFWRIDPTVQSTLLNLNGLAHKVTWDAELLFADSSQNLDQLPLYNQLDDDAQEFFRRRFAFDPFGIIPGQDVPLAFDERFYALRSGLQSNVTSPVPEIADDLTIFRTGLRNRWQTKRGLPGQARTIDWITFDIEGSFFPRANRDNFGSDVGLVNYDFRWHIGDRFSVVSDGHFDFFGQGLRTASFGVHMSRPARGNLFVGFRTIEGPISSNVLTAAGSYRMSDKWIVRGVSTYDFASTGNIGQSLNFTRIGESFLLNFGVNADISRDNVGFVFGFEPRFLQTGNLGVVGGRRIPPASSEYLE